MAFYYFHVYNNIHANNDFEEELNGSVIVEQIVAEHRLTLCKRIAAQPYDDIV